jgi:hypothetical protein
LYAKSRPREESSLALSEVGSITARKENLHYRKVLPPHEKGSGKKKG